ncbi:Major facilitator superfamily domain general substrate transporter [Penicillium verrucosum]|uniref:Major facilitator superfamily domain general substrate transporter n=1 Tax=Penicillium verrucosum TaxID=60171 RepID=UPI0025451D92|nr:Major facilitator superfamily domain general substrate transporter [Penicillium verrucosum]KAJ5940107.1 Major facilitator superfamily domain general substrate transporter [Penicillium verrucosum]
MDEEKTTVEHSSEPDPTPRPAGWMYKSNKIGKFSTSWYASPRIQLGMVAFVCFLCPGMFNALSGMGGGGKSDPSLADKMNIALNSTFAVVGFFAGTVVNRIGVRLSLSFGGVGYCIYSISLLVSEHAYVPGFNIFAGAFLGVCAGLLWAAQGTIMMSYPIEQQKGRYFAWFWGIFNVGACIGSLIPLGQNIHVTENKTVGDGTYIAFIVLMFAGACLALCLCDADKVVRPDGSRVILMKHPSWKSEIVGLWETVRSEPWIILLFPMFWSSNWFYTYQQNAINGAYFNTRTKALNGFLYWFAQIVAAVIMGPLLDSERVRRSIRAKAALVGLFVLTVVIWGGGYAWQVRYTREDVDPKTTDFKGWDWTTKGYVGPMFLYFFYGMYDAAWQGIVYWIMGALGNSGRKLANLAGFYKGLQSAGAAVMWSLDERKLPFMNEYASNFGLLCGSILIAVPVVFFKIKDSVPAEEELEGTGETLEDVLPPGVVESKRVGDDKI